MNTDDRTVRNEARTVVAIDALVTRSAPRHVQARFGMRTRF
jgi:hypothetical protein